MTYVTANRRPNAAALAGALGVPAGMAALLVVGLAVKAVIAPPQPPLTGETYVETKLPPPPPPKPDDPQVKDRVTESTTTIPDPLPVPSLPPTPFPFGDPAPLPPGPGGLTGTETGPIGTGIPGPTPTAALFDPVGAQPKNNPGRWVTNADYKNRWILEEMAGTARFSLSIDARGKVTGCSITRSTGHAPLDAATCDLVTKRARFDAARDNTGKPVAGSYTGVITWQIPK